MLNIECFEMFAGGVIYVNDIRQMGALKTVVFSKLLQISSLI